MTAKEYLSQIQIADRRIQTNIEKLNDIKGRAFIKSPNLNSTKIQTSHDVDKISSNVAEAVDLERKIEVQISDYLKLKHDIINQIQALDDPDCINVLYLRYIEYKTFDDIATDTGFCIRNIYCLHGKALIIFQEMFGDLLQ